MKKSLHTRKMQSNNIFLESYVRFVNIVCSSCGYFIGLTDFGVRFKLLTVYSLSFSQPFKWPRSKAVTKIGSKKAFRELRNDFRNKRNQCWEFITIIKISTLQKCWCVRYYKIDLLYKGPVLSVCR